MVGSRVFEIVFAFMRSFAFAQVGACVEENNPQSQFKQNLNPKRRDGLIFDRSQRWSFTSKGVVPLTIFFLNFYFLVVREEGGGFYTVFFLRVDPLFYFVCNIQFQFRLYAK